MVVALPTNPRPPISLLIMNDEFLWVERYRPHTIADTVLNAKLKKHFTEIVKDGNLPNMILAGTAGLGKTTVAKALCDEMDLDWIMINASEEGGIDTLRVKIRQFASSVSLNGGHKVVILDEADHLNPQSTQPALRGFIEEFSNNCRFILTCNFKNRLIDPLHSRCPPIDFNTNKKEMAKLAEQFMKDVLMPMLTKEGVKFTPQVLARLVVKYAPDWRKIINICQRYGPTGEISSDILLDVNDQNIAQVVGYLKAKDFKSMRAWVVNNSDLDGTATFRGIYDALTEYVAPSSIPQAILTLADYSYKSAFMADKELNLVACLTELMCELKRN